MLDYRLFASNMAGLCQVFEGELTDLLLDVYYSVLRDLTDEQFKTGVRNIMHERKMRKLPLPRELKDACLGDIQSRAIQAWEIFETALLKYHSYTSFVFDDKTIHSVVVALGGLIEIAETKDTEWKWMRKAFIELYQEHLRHPRSNVPERLPGRIEMDNAAKQIPHKIRVAHVTASDSKPGIVAISYSPTNQIEGTWDSAGDAIKLLTQKLSEGMNE